jgi:hypothetical protein
VSIRKADSATVDDGYHAVNLVDIRGPASKEMLDSHLDVCPQSTIPVRVDTTYSSMGSIDVVITQKIHSELP